MLVEILELYVLTQIAWLSSFFIALLPSPVSHNFVAFFVPEHTCSLCLTELNLTLPAVNRTFLLIDYLPSGQYMCTLFL